VYKADQAFRAVTVSICAGRVVSTKSKRAVHLAKREYVLNLHCAEQRTSQVKEMQGKETVICAIVEMYNTFVYKLNYCVQIISLSKSFFLT